MIDAKGRIARPYRNRELMYVLEPEGNIRIGSAGQVDDLATAMTHVSLIGGENPTVLAAGRCYVDGSGRIRWINNDAPDYFTPGSGSESLLVAFDAFRRLAKSALHRTFKAVAVRQ
jgi:hypothetical protein